MNESRKPLILAYSTIEPVQDVEEVIPILFLHDVMKSKEHWGDIPQVVANATGRKIHSLDARNHGESPWGDFFDFQINVDDLLLFMENMNISKAILVGHGMGGITVMQAALRSPERVEMIIVEEMTVKGLNSFLYNRSLSYLNSAKSALKLIPLGSTLDDAKSFINAYAHDNLPAPMKQHLEKNTNNGHLNLKQTSDGVFEFKSNLDVLIPALKEINRYPIKFDGHYNGPACFIYGECSPFLVGRDEHAIKNHFTKAKMVCIKSALSEVHQDFPLPFTEELLNFIQGGWNKKKYFIKI